MNLYEFIVEDGQYNVYAMDYKDAWATLFENEPKIKPKDIMFMTETKCATKNETLHKFLQNTLDISILVLI